jgi:hypothetical protein
MSTPAANKKTPGRMHSGNIQHKQIEENKNPL